MTNIVVVGREADLEAFISQATTNGVRYYGVDPTDEGTGGVPDGYHVLGGNNGESVDLDAVVIIDAAAYGVLEAGLDAVAEVGDDLAVLLAVPFITATTVASELGGGIPVATFSWVPGASSLGDQIEYSPALQADAVQQMRLRDLLSTICPGNLSEVQDRVAHVSMRILAMIINEAAFALQEGVAEPADIDSAMKYGTNYPDGPLAWCDRIGADVIVAILDGLQLEYGEERYRPAVLLRQYARAGRLFFQPVAP